MGYKHVATITRCQAESNQTTKAEKRGSFFVLYYSYRPKRDKSFFKLFDNTF